MTVSITAAWYWARCTQRRNDHDRPLTDLAQLILLRWGQENFFKRRNVDGTLDHTPGYDFEVTPDDPLVDNPQIETLRKEKSHLQARLERLHGQLGANLLERKRDTIELAQYKAQHDQLIQDIVTLEHQVEALKLQLKALPKQVPISQVLGQPLEQANSERKTFLDTLAILADQAESSLLDMLAQVDPGRDHRIAEGPYDSPSRRRGPVDRLNLAGKAQAFRPAAPSTSGRDLVRGADRAEGAHARQIWVPRGVSSHARHFVTHHRDFVTPAARWSHLPGV